VRLALLIVFGAFLAGCAAEEVSEAEQQVLPRVKTPPNVVIFLMDSLRPDFLGCYGHPVKASPNIDALAAESLQFMNCYGQGCWTVPSVGALMSGYLPSVHQVANIRNEDGKIVHGTLREQFVTMAEVFQAAGYETGAFFANCNGEIKGLTQGFDCVWVQHRAHIESHLQEVEAWLSTIPQGKPFFAYIHTWDPHFGYEPSPEVFKELFGEPAPLSENDRFLISNYAKMVQAFYDRKETKVLRLTELSPQGMDHVRKLYTAVIHHVDLNLSGLIQMLKTRGAWDNTIFVLTADHGDEFREHGGFVHNHHSLMNEILHVPLIMKVPGVAPSRVEVTTSMFDIFPSVAVLCGLQPPLGIQARSMFTATGEFSVLHDTAVFSEAEVEPRISVIQGGLKCILDMESGSTLYFNLEADPGEKNPNPSLPSADKERMKALLNNKLQENERIRGTLGPLEWETYQAEVINQLRALGYL